MENSQERGYATNIKMKKTIIFLLLISILPLVMSATPQVVFTSVNMTVMTNCSGTYYTIKGEGINANDWFGTPLTIAGYNGTNATCTGNFTYVKDLIPITLSRTFENNDTDMAILLHSLATNNNVTQKFLDCQKELTSCNMDYGFRENFTSCQRDVSNMIIERDNQVKNSEEKQTEIEKLKQHRTILFVVALASVGYGVYVYRKNTPKTVRAPIASQFPSSSRIN